MFAVNARPRIALLGCGRIGQVHLRTLLAHPEVCELAIVVDANERALLDVAEQWRLDRTATDPAAAFDDPTIDAVVIAASTETHAPYIEEAARSEKAAFCEKPIALDMESTDQALAAVNASGTQLQIGFQRRFDSGYAAARRAIEAGELGAVEMIHDAVRDPSPPSTAYLCVSGGLYRDMTIHNFDCVRWLKGEDPVEVYAAGSAIASEEIRELGDIDTSVVILRFEDGSLATIENSRRSGFGYDVRTEIFGSKAAVFVGDSRETPIRTYDASGVHEDHNHFFLERFAAAYRSEMLAFVDAVRSDTETLVTGADGKAAMAIAIAAEKSRTIGGPVPFTG